MTFNETYLSLIKLGIGHEAEVPAVVDWKAVRNLSSGQGLAAIVLDGVKVLMEKGSPALASMDIDFKFDWMAESVVVYEQRYKEYRKTIASLAKFYSEHGFKMMVLKGYGLSLNYPVPKHRPCGDIDIWQFGHYKETDEVLSRELRIEIDNGHHHHTVFVYKGYTVENHYDIINLYYGNRNRELEVILKQLAADDSNYVELPVKKAGADVGDSENNETVRVYLPSANLHALFQIKHCITHFASTFISVRQLLDFALFVEKHSSFIDWKWLNGVLKDFGMLDFYNYLVAVCVKDLGFDFNLFGVDSSSYQIDPAMKERILSDMISPEFTEEEPKKKGIIPRVAFKFRRWQANAWKQRLCYPGSRFVAFLKNVWAHILKPESI